MHTFSYSYILIAHSSKYFHKHSYLDAHAYTFARAEAYTHIYLYLDSVDAGITHSQTYT